MTYQTLELSKSLQNKLDDAETSNKYVTALVRVRINELVLAKYCLSVEGVRELTALENYLAN